MAQLIPAGDSGALDDINVTQGELRSQLAALVDLMRQVAGDAAVVAGSSAPMDPLSAPFTLYVNPYTGSDKFVGGSYNDYEAAGASDEAQIAQKLKRLELQRMTCGFTPQRPFKTINRAVIEAAIITSKNWYTYTDPRAHVDCVSIVLAPGVHTVYNDPGSGLSALASWGTEKDPTVAELIAFNPTEGGLLLPRGCSLCGPDLRKTTIRPSWVPPRADEAADYSNRSSILRITGTGYFFGFTAMDKVGLNQSHHLLDVFQFASKAQLDLFYEKCFNAVGVGADLSETLTVSRGTEYEIVGPIDTTQVPTSAWDTTASASPYIFNCSVRSDYGMGGAFMDGSKVQGLKSMVVAQYTGVSLQKDMECWQHYVDGNWVNNPTYEQYIGTDPDNIRMNPARLSRHICAINDSFIQEVSVFAIGHGIHHFTDKGGEVTITNSNSSFGGCAALSRGYKSYAFPSDKSWSVAGIKVARDVSELTGNIRFIYLGIIEAVDGSTITLQNDLAVSPDSATVPSILLRDGYTLKGGTQIWVENPSGLPWHTTLTNSAWDANAPDTINISAALTKADDSDSNPVGKRVYIRRLVDTRTPAERRYSLILSNTSAARLPQTNTVLQTDPLRGDGSIDRLFTEGGAEVFAVSTSGVTEVAGVPFAAEVTIRRNSPTLYSNYVDGVTAEVIYPAGTVVRSNGKHWVTPIDVKATGDQPDPSIWKETYVHMQSGYNAEDPLTQEGRIITFDTDTSTDPYSTTLGIGWATIWNSNSFDVKNQLRASTDYKGVHAFLMAMGYGINTAHGLLLPRAEASRLLDPASAIDFPTAPSGSGAAAGRANWAIEFRRPSVVRLYGHAWEWAGFLNYSKSIPASQKDLGPQNKFSYYFTHEAGGRVVPQGSNEDGFNITPRGLENIETGATLSVENIGNSTVDESNTTSFGDISATKVTVGQVVITPTGISGLDTAKGRTDRAGVVQLAGSTSLGNFDSALDADINARSEVVTKPYLDRWKTENRLVSQRPETIVVYVNPTLATSVTDVTQLLLNPPLSATNAVKTLKAAADYANAATSPSETVEFRLGPGLYLESEDITFKSRAVIRAWNYSSNSYLNDDADGPLNNSIPFSYTNYSDPTKQPTFLTRPVFSYSRSPEIFSLRSRPLKLIFEQEASVIGVTWWGLEKTVTAPRTGTSGVPDSFFTGNRINVSTWRDLAIQNVGDNAINHIIGLHASATSPTPGAFYSMFMQPCMEFYKKSSIANVAIGAMRPATIDLNTQFSNVGDGLIVLHSSELLSIKGLSLVGNIKVSSELNASAYPSVKLKIGNQSVGNYTGTSYFLTGHCPYVIVPERSSDSVCFTFGPMRSTGTRVNDTGLNYNFADNNINLVNNSLQIATTTPEPNASSGSGWKTSGPAIYAWIDVFGALLDPSTTSFLAQAANPGARPGFSGKFGTYYTANDATQSTATQVRSTGLSPRISSSDTSVTGALMYAFGGDGTTSSSAETMFYTAGSGTNPPRTLDINQGPGAISTTYLNFDDLNIRYRVTRRGVDVFSSNTARRNLAF